MKKVLFLALPLMFATAIFAQQAKFVEISSEFIASSINRKLIPTSSKKTDNRSLY